MVSKVDSIQRSVSLCMCNVYCVYSYMFIKKKAHLYKRCYLESDLIEFRSPSACPMDAR